MDVLNLIIWKSDPPHSPGFVVVVFLRAAVICLFSDFSKRFLPRIFHLCEVSILLSQRSACDLTETKRKKKILSCFLKLALIWGIPACDTKLCPMICQWYKPTVLSRLFRAYIWPWACVLHSGFLSICESPPKFLFSHISSSSASSSLGFLVCLLLVPPNIPCPRWLGWYVFTWFQHMPPGKSLQSWDFQRKQNKDKPLFWFLVLRETPARLKKIQPQFFENMVHIVPCGIISKQYQNAGYHSHGHYQARNEGW